MSDNKTKPYWHDAAMAFGRMTGWIASPVVAAVFIGKWLDAKYSSGQKMFFIAMGVSFFVSMFGVALEARRYMRKVKWSEENKKDGN